MLLGCPTIRLLAAAAIILISGLSCVNSPPTIQPEITALATPFTPFPLEIRTQLGHTNYINTLTVSHDGLHALSGSNDKAIILWDIATGREMRRLTEPLLSFVYCVEFSPDDKYALSGSYDGLRLWDLATGKQIIHYKVGLVVSSNFSSDGRRILALTGEGSIKIYDRDNPAVQLSVKAWAGEDCQSGISWVSFSPDNKKVFSCTDNRVKTWDSSTLIPIKTFGDKPPEPKYLAFSPDGRYVLPSYPIALWDLATGKMSKKLEPDEANRYKRIVAMRFSEDGSQVMTIFETGTTISWDVESGKEIQRSTFESLPKINRIALCPDLHFSLISDGKSISQWDMATGTELRRFVGETTGSAGVFSVAMTPDWKGLVAGSGDGSLRYWRLDNAKLAFRYPNPAGLINSVAIAPNGLFSVTGSTDNEVKLWGLEHGNLIRTLGSHRLSVDAVAISPDGRYAASGSTDETIKLWDLSSGSCLASYDFHKGPRDGLQVNFSHVHSLAFTRDSTNILVGVEDRMNIWNIQSGKVLRSCVGHTRNILSIDTSVDGKYALTGSEDMNVRLWDLATGRCLGVFGGYDNEGGVFDETRAVFSPDGKSFAASYSDKSIWLWDIATKDRVKIFTGHSDRIISIAFSPEGKSIMSASRDGTVRIWDLATSSWLALSAVGNKWIIFTSDGYWDGSADCSSLVAMVIGLNSWSIDQFATWNNRPDIIASRLDATPELIADLKRAFEKRLHRMGLRETDIKSEYRAPTTTIVSATRVITAQQWLSLDLRFVANGKPLSAYQIYSNDVPLFGVAGKPLAGMFATATERIELVNGANKIEISCRDLAGVESYRANLVVNWKDDTIPNLYYIGFGVSDYIDPTIRDLKYAAKDARDLSALFKGMEGQGFGKVYTKTYEDGMVTKESVTTAKSFLAEARPCDIFVLFISGHGVYIDTSRKKVESGVSSIMNNSGGDLTQSEAIIPGEIVLPLTTVSDVFKTELVYFYLTADAQLDNIADTALSFDEVDNLLQGIQPRQKLFLMDTCESGESDGSGLDISSTGAKGIYARTISKDSMKGLKLQASLGTNYAIMKDRWISNDLLRRSGAIVFSSSRGNEASLEADAWKQGAFTYAIITAFGDRSTDQDKDGRISTNELRTYVEDLVPRLVSSIDPSAQQHPTVDRDNIFASFGFPFTRNRR
ncbi:MAG: hypothetical protein A3J97_14570 [Spirochaetes bacterium RIFOXYC1_FULL_54_7]|nr:MAG: hypothetical protein A3J97_14570 [Spirochaetes bacterium RIFOXYC1_FULL_54_7]